MMKSAARPARALTFGYPPGGAQVSLAFGASGLNDPCHPTYDPYSASRSSTSRGVFTRGFSAPLITGTSVRPACSVAHKAKTVAGSTHWSPLTVVIPSKSISGARSSISNESRFVPCGPPLSWSAITLIFFCWPDKEGTRKNVATRMHSAAQTRARECTFNFNAPWVVNLFVTSDELFFVVRLRLHQPLDHRHIFQRRRIARHRALRRQLPQQPAHDFSTARLWQQRRKTHIRRSGNRADRVRDMIHQLIAQFLRRLKTRAQRHKTNNRFALDFIRS